MAQIPRAARLHAARLRKELTPSSRIYSKYRRCADLFLHAHAEQRPLFRLRDERVMASHLNFHSSVLFRRAYLVAWVDDDAYRRAVPGVDAMVAPVGISAESPLIPLILAPESRIVSRSEAFVSILEHEVVHVNQALYGHPIPEFKADSLSELFDCFGAYAKREYEANLIQLVRWPSAELLRTTVSFDQWVLLRAYTPAIELILRETASGRIRRGLLPRFLDGVPTSAPALLRKLGCPRDLTTWFQKRWSAHVFTALKMLKEQGVDLTCAPLRPACTWVMREAEKARQGTDSQQPSNEL